MKIFVVMVLLALPLAWMAVLEPMRMGPVHDKVRGASVLTNKVAPRIEVIEPANGGVWEGRFVIRLTNWDYKPELATSTSTEFCSGFIEAGRGHSHMWMFDESGKQVKFYGAGGWTNIGSGLLMRTDSFPPGKYQSFFQLQNHDHSAALPPSAPTMPGIDSVTFTVL